MFSLSLSYVITFRSTFAVPSVAVVCSLLILCLSGRWLRYFLGDFEVITCLCYYWSHFRLYIPHTLYFLYCAVFIFYDDYCYYYYYAA